MIGYVIWTSRIYMKLVALELRYVSSVVKFHNIYTLYSMDPETSEDIRLAGTGRVPEHGS